jgi:hypothetical protein
LPLDVSVSCRSVSEVCSIAAYASVRTDSA